MDNIMNIENHDQIAFQKDLKSMAWGILGWSIFYLSVKITPLSWFVGSREISKKHELDLRNRVVSFVHGFLAMLAGGYHFLQGGAECGETNTELQRMVMVFSLSYFIYDTFAMAAEGILDVSMMIHHPLCLAGLFIPLYENISGNFCMLAIFLSEISNPPMHLRQMLRLTGRRYTKSYEAVEIMFIMMYCYARFVAIGPIAIQTITCESNHLFLKISCAGLMIQSFYFIIQMYKLLC
jgi:hypothetical protein